MLKLYRLSDLTKEYWETWEDEDGSHIVHCGELATQGTLRTIKSTPTQKAQSSIQGEINAVVAQGFAPIDQEDHAVLIIEYAIEGMGSRVDLEKRHRLEDRMNELLGWTGLGACDGGSIGSGTMEVCVYVVDFELSKNVIEADLVGTEFSNFTKIYDEDAE